jgi:3-oxoacyl-[acyl-carrier-protein] synthase II
VTRPWTGEDLAVTGLGCVTPFGSGADALIAGWIAGGRAPARIDRFGTERLPVHVGGELHDLPSAGGEVHRGAAALDAAADEALAESGLAHDARVLVIVSTSKGFLHRGDDLDATAGTHEPGLPARRLARRFRASECVTVSTACAGGTAAFVLALARAVELRRGDFDAVVVAGVDLLSDFVYRGFSALAAVDPAPCRPFDVTRAGMSPSEAAAVVVLETLGRARGRGATPRGRVLGGGLSSDAGHPTAPDPAGRGLARAIRHALTWSGVANRDLGHVHAHGTGTVLNDAMEVQALRTALGTDAAHLPLTTLKGSIGHPFGAAGVVEVAASLLAVGRGVLPGIAGLGTALAGIDAVTSPRDLVLPVFLKVGAGFGGFNAALVAEGVLP